MTEFKWEAPPPITSRGPKPAEFWVELAAALRQRPGEWVSLGRMHSQTAGNIKAGMQTAFRPRGDYDAVTRNSEVVDGHREGDIYVRYVGPT